MVFSHKMTAEYADILLNGGKISQFMNQYLCDHTLHSLSFWDIGYIYWSLDYDGKERGVEKQ